MDDKIPRHDRPTQLLINQSHQAMEQPNDQQTRLIDPPTLIDIITEKSLFSDLLKTITPKEPNMNSKTKSLVAKSTSEGWARAHSFRNLLHTAMGVSDKELGTPSQARSFISANKHHDAIDEITDATKDGKPINITTVQKLKPLLANYQQFLLGHKKFVKRKSKKVPSWEERTPAGVRLADWRRNLAAKMAAKTKAKMSVATPPSQHVPGIEALQDLRTFQNKYKLTAKDVIHLAQTLQSLQIPRFADPSTTTRPPK